MMFYLGASCNPTDDDNFSLMSPHFDEYHSGTGKKNDLIYFLVD